MSFNDEKRILVRLLKKKGNYRINSKVMEYINREHSCVYKAIDCSFMWGEEMEGYEFFYFLQLDLISLLCANDLCEDYLNYYNRLLTLYGRNRGLETDKRFLMHKDIYESFSLKIV